MNKKIKKSPTKILLLGLLILILVGTIFLKLPISNQENKNISMMDAFFTATSATCVTGLITKITVEQFSLFGQIVILLLVQIGGIRFDDYNIINFNFFREKN